MIQYIDIKEFLQMAADGVPLFDVRSPAEFTQGHIPCAQSLPLFSDAERAEVGTLYSKEGASAAVHKGLELVGARLSALLYQAEELAGGVRRVLVHCWRGGQRSGSVAWLLEQGGFEVFVLRGGYKAYRQAVRQDFCRSARVHVLGGMTGSGKTDILHAMRAQGAQVIDLEGLAGHRGSVFGAVGLPHQPSSEMCENMLHAEWTSLDFSRPVWLEDESRRIGSVALCDEFFHYIETGNMVIIEVPHQARIRRLVELYAAEECQKALCQCLNVLQKRLGHEAYTVCGEALAHKNYALAAEILLKYYDKTYAHGQTRDNYVHAAAPVVLPDEAPDLSAARLLTLYGV